MLQQDTDTICAIATPAGRGGIGIIRVSGPKAAEICARITGSLAPARSATRANFRDDDSTVIDQGLVLYFPAPNSFTGEDVLELQGHGGPHVLHAVLSRTQQLGARLARPGEFTERAFLNGKVDLLQAEAVADLIDASSQQAARSAMRTLQGVFSAKVNEIVNSLTRIRVNVEAAIDFSDEDIDILERSGVATELAALLAAMQSLFREAEQGALLKEGIHLVLAGTPNVGKSSLMNALCGNESAIVTDIPGTTRDLLREQLNIDGLPITITDTAGLRVSQDPVEQEGVRRATKVINEADRIFLVIDGEREQTLADEAGQRSIPDTWMETLLGGLGEQDAMNLLRRTSIILNKIDLLSDPEPRQFTTGYKDISLKLFRVSAKQGLGLDLLRDDIKRSVGYSAPDSSAFLARQRHLIALEEAYGYMENANSGVSEHLLLELVAEDLRLAQQTLGKITGEVSSDDLLGEIFSSFCIGK